MCLEVETTESATRKIQLREKAKNAGERGRQLLEECPRAGEVGWDPGPEGRQECTRSVGSSLQAASLPRLSILSAPPENTVDIMDPSQQKRLPLEILSIFRFSSIQTWPN